VVFNKKSQITGEASGFPSCNLTNFDSSIFLFPTSIIKKDKEPVFFIPIAQINAEIYNQLQHCLKKRNTIA